MVFGIDDLAFATLASGALAAGAHAMSGSSSSSSNKKAERIRAKSNKETSKISAREAKRQTLADMYNKALQRQFDLYQFNQELEGTNAARRAAALQEAANGFTRALH